MSNFHTTVNYQRILSLSWQLPPFSEFMWKDSKKLSIKSRKVISTILNLTETEQGISLNSINHWEVFLLTKKVFNKLYLSNYKQFSLLSRGKVPGTLEVPGTSKVQKLFNNKAIFFLSFFSCLSCVSWANLLLQNRTLIQCDQFFKSVIIKFG